MQRNHHLAARLLNASLSRKQLLLSLIAVPWLAATRRGPLAPLVARAQEGAGSAQTGEGIPTLVTVSVIANGGKFLGDDIGGATVSIRDAHTAQVLASGRTRGGAGPVDLMTIETTRSDPLPDDGAATFTTTLMLDEPRLVEVIAVGPLAAQEATGRASVTRWLLPDGSTAGSNHVVLTLDGLIVEILNPPTHFLPATPAPLAIDFRVNVTMMCGCPIGAGLDWAPQDFQVEATIKGPDGSRSRLPLSWDAAALDGAPSQFIGTWTAPAAGVYEATVTARQPVHDNVGVDRATFTLT